MALIPDLLALQRTNTPSMSEVGGYYAVSTTGGINLFIPHTHITTDAVSDPTKLVKLFIPDPTAGPNIGHSLLTTSALDHESTASVYVNRKHAGSFIRDPSLFPNLLSQGLIIQHININESGVGRASLSNTVGPVQTTDVELVDGNFDLSITDDNINRLVNPIAGRMLRVLPESSLALQTELDIDICFKGTKDSRNALWLPVMTGTGLNFPNFSNRIEGYMAVAELATGNGNPSLNVSEGDYIFMVTVEARSHHTATFSLQDAKDISDNITRINGSKPRWMAVVFNKYAGFENNTPVLTKLYNIDNDPILINWVTGAGDIDYFGYDTLTSTPVTATMDESWFTQVDLQDADNTRGSIASRMQNVPLTISDQTTPPVSDVPFVSVRVHQAGTGSTLYIPKWMAVKDFTDYTGTSALLEYSLPNTDFSVLSENTQTILIESNASDINTGDRGLIEPNSLIIRRLPDTDSLLISQVSRTNNFRYTRVDLDTAVLVGEIENKVSPSIANSALDLYLGFINNVLFDSSHHMAPSTGFTPVSQEFLMAQTGAEVTNSISDVLVTHPSSLDIVPSLRSLYAYGVYSSAPSDVKRWGLKTDLGDATTYHLYFNIKIEPAITGGEISDVVWSIYNTDIYPQNPSDLSGMSTLYTLTFNGTLLTAKTSAGEVDFNIGNQTSGTGLIDLQVDKIGTGFNAVIFLDGNLVGTLPSTNLEWFTKVGAQFSVGKFRSGQTSVWLNNLAFYPVGTEITGDAQIDLIRLPQDGIPDASKVCWDLRSNPTGESVMQSITLYVPNFFLADSPVAEGVSKVELPFNDNTEDEFSIIFSTLTSVNLITSITASNTFGQSFRKRGAGFILLKRSLSGGAYTLDITSSLWYDLGDIDKTLTDLPIQTYGGTTVNGYKEASLTPIVTRQAKSNRISARLPIVDVGDVSNLPTVGNPNNVYKTSPHAPTYFVIASGLLTHDPYNTTMSVLEMDGIDTLIDTATDLWIYNEIEPLDINNLVAPDNADTILLRSDLQTLTFRFYGVHEVGGNLEWDPSILSTTFTTGESLPKLTGITTSPLIGETLSPVLKAPFVGPKRLPLFKMSGLSDIPTTLSPDRVYFYEDSGSYKLALASDWSSAPSTLGNTVESFTLPSDIHNNILQALINSSHILIDSSVNDGSLINMAQPDVKEETLALLRDANGMKLSYRFKDGVVITLSSTLTGTTESSLTTSTTLDNVPLVTANVLYTEPAPIGSVSMVPVDLDPASPDKIVHVSETVVNTDHVIVLSVPVGAFFDDRVNSSHMELTFTLIDDSEIDIVSVLKGICILGLSDDEPSANLYQKGNIYLRVEALGNITVHYHNGASWDDIVLTSYKPVLLNTSLSGKNVSKQKCSNIIPTDDVYRTAKILDVSRLSIADVRGDNVVVEMDDGQVHCYLASSWLTLDPLDDKIVKMTSPGSTALYNARSIAMYSANDFGNITQLPAQLPGNTAVIFSKKAYGVTVYIMKDNLVIDSFDMSASVISETIQDDVIIPSNLTSYSGGFTPLSNLIGGANVVVRALSEVDQTRPNEVSFVTHQGTNALYIPSIVLTGDVFDRSIYKVAITSLDLIDLLATEPLACLFHGEIDPTELNEDSATRIYISSSDLTTVNIDYNTLGNVLVGIYHTTVVATEVLLTVSPSSITYSPCDIEVGCTMSYLPGATMSVSAINVNEIASVIGQGWNVNTTQLTLSSKAGLSKTPTNVIYRLPFDSAETEVIFVSFKREPRGIASATAVGLPTSASEFIVALSLDESHLLNVYGDNKVPSSLGSMLLVRFSRYTGIPTVVSNGSNGDIIPTVHVSDFNPLVSDTGNVNDITGSSHDIRIALVKVLGKTEVYIYEGDQLRSRTNQSVLPWFIPKSMTLHYHSTNDALSTEALSDIRAGTSTSLLGCLPDVETIDLDCPNMRANISTAKSIEVTDTVNQLLGGLQPMSREGYIHVTVTNPSTTNALVSLYVTDNASPTPTDIVLPGTLNLAPGTSYEYASVHLSEDQKTFIESNNPRVTARIVTIEDLK